MRSSARVYPDPPWEMHGFAVFRPYVVPVRSLALPPDLTPIAVAGRALGMLGYVRYEAPSPLVYQELIWMPAVVRHRSAGRGYWVSRMWVDSEASLRGGREIWAIPKTLARFEPTESGVTMHADHHTEIVLGWARLSPTVPARSRISTLQVDGDRIVRFRARTRARTGVARFDVLRLSSSDPELESLDRASPIAGIATMLAPFESTMLPPQVLPR